MSARVYQQVNLFQPIFRRQRQVFSASVLLPSLGVFMLALGLISAYGYFQVRALELEAVRLEGRERAQSAQLASLDPGSGARRRADIESELERLTETLLEQQRLIEVLEEQPLGALTGFSDKLRALGRQRTSGLWLTRIEIDGATSGVELAGKSIRPSLVPEFLLGLGEEAALEGLLFDEFNLDRDSDATVDFRVASRAIALKSDRRESHR